MTHSVSLLGIAIAMLSANPTAVYGKTQDKAAETNSPESKPGDPIISDEEFDNQIPELDDKPLETIEEWQKWQDQGESRDDDREDPAIPALQDGDPVEEIADAPVTDPEIEEALKPIDSFDADPPPAATQDEDIESTATIRYEWQISGLDVLKKEFPDVEQRITDQFSSLSVLVDGGGKADNGAQIAARLSEDEILLLNILNGQGFYDSLIQSDVQSPQDGGRVQINININIGPRYRLGNIRFDAQPVLPADLIAKNFVPKSGDPIVAERILAAEANLSVVLPQNGYPFATVGQRDILLDPDTETGDYTLPVDTGKRSYFGNIIADGNPPFDAAHIELLRRFNKGDLYDARELDDLRAALVATGLLSVVSVKPVESKEAAEDGTAFADLLVTMEKAPPRTLAATGGYETGRGIRVEGSWTHRNLFPPEGALSVSALAGTQEQGASLTFRRSNAGKRDRTVELGLNLTRSDFDAFQAYTGRLAGRISYDSTPLWQKPFTYAYGFELLASSERDFDFTAGERRRDLYYVAALPGQIGFDKTDSLLDPTKGFRLNLKLSPEASLGSGTQIYARSVLEATGYYGIGDNLILAGRARAGSIAGAQRENIAPSRRYYGGGGGSVRGFGFQELGPRDPDNDPIGGRSLNEAAIEARYRFGNYGLVGFIDAGQVYESSLPQFDDWRFGLGIGGRFYTNFGPLRLDIATPLNRREGESRVSIYISIGQAF